jgi:antitoxin CcdA
MTMLYDKSAKKKPTNLTINSELLKKAKEYNLNLSNCLEQVLEKQIKNIEKEQWEKENKEAIDNYNSRIKQYGLFSNGLRSF